MRKKKQPETVPAPDPDPTLLGTKAAAARTDTEASEAEAMQAIVMLAATIKCDRDFILVLADSDPSLRQQVYELIAPHVTYSPRPFALMSFEADA